MLLAPHTPDEDSKDTFLKVVCGITTLQSSTFPSTFYVLEIQFSQNCLH